MKHPYAWSQSDFIIPRVTPEAHLWHLWNGLIAWVFWMVVDADK